MGIVMSTHQEAPRPLTCAARPRRPGNRGLTLGLWTPARLTRRAPASSPSEESSEKSRPHARQSGAEREAPRRVSAGGSPRTGDALVPSRMGLCSPGPAPFTCATTGRRSRRRPPVRARDPLALPRASLREGDGGASVDLGQAGLPPIGGYRGLSSLSDY